MILEGFAEKLADIIVKGQASIGDWNSDAGAKINVSSCPHYLIAAGYTHYSAAVDTWFFG
jgi:hypothetical protein